MWFNYINVFFLSRKDENRTSKYKLCLTIKYLKHLHYSILPGHPLQAYLDEDLGALLSAEDVNGVITSILQSLVRYIELLRNLLLITDIFESLKFAVALYAVTYVGDMFNLLTIFIILHVALFTIPKVIISVYSFLVFR